MTMARKATPHTNVPSGDPFWTARGAYELAGRRGIDPGTAPMQTWVPGGTPPPAGRTRVTGDDQIHVKGKHKEKFPATVRTEPITVAPGKPARSKK
jgi:hypothetical protein